MRILFITLYKKIPHVVFILFLFASTSGCSFLFLNSDDDFRADFTRTDTILVVIEDELLLPLESVLAEYTVDIAAEGVTAIVIEWKGGNALYLRNLLQEYYISDHINGAFLVGDLPTVWYEMIAHENYEEFPCDLYFMDMDSTWTDRDGNFLYDSHSPLSLHIFVSRAMGTESEIINYFNKVHAYRSGSLQMPAGAFVFKDDDWYNYQPGSSFGLSKIYADVSIYESPSITFKTDYLEKLTNSGSEFIYQWIHSYPRALCVAEDNSYNTISTIDIKNSNPIGLFYNLYDCSAARFTEENLAMNYLMQTDYALATFGSTKVGGSFQSLAFFDVLSQNGTWGDAYKSWYNYYGKKMDSWFLGMVIFGDPTLSVNVTAPSYRFVDMSLPVEPGTQQITELKDIFFQFSELNNYKGFKEYKTAHPEFFN